MIGRFRQWVERLEELPIGAGAWTAGFLGIVAVRHYLELRSGGFPLYPASALYVHYMLAYLAPLLALCLVLALSSGVALERILRLMLLAWGLTLLPPFVDMLAARAHEARIGYLELGDTPWSTVLLRFFDPTYALGGTTVGIRVETAVACLLGAAYALLRARNARLLRAAGAVAGVYVTSLFVFTAPWLFFRAIALFVPGLTPANLYNAQGMVPRPASLDVRTDQGVLIYLVPFTLALGATALGLTRPALLRRSLRALAASEGWMWAVASLLGTWAGWRILEGIPRPARLVPFDLLAAGAGPLALILAGGAFALLAAGDDRSEPGLPGERGAGLVLLLGAAFLAPACSIEYAGFAAMALGAGLLARGIPRYLPWAILAPQAASGIAVLAAFTAGYALRAGDEAITLLPGGLLLLVVLAGVLADLPRASAGSGRTLTLLARAGNAAVPLACIALPALALAAPIPAAAVLLAAVFAAASFALAFALPPRTAAAASLLGGAAVLAGLLATPGHPAAWREKALASPVWFLRLSDRAEAAGDLDLAAGAADEAVRRAPSSAAAHHRLGLVRYKRGDYTGAIAELQRAAGLEPANADLGANLASALLKAGRPAEALASAGSAIAADPSKPSAWFVRAQCLDELGRRAEADAAWREYVARAEGVTGEESFLAIARQRLASAPPR